MELRTGITRGHYSVLSDKASVSPSRSRNPLTGAWRLPKSTLLIVSILLTSTVTGIVAYLAGKRSVLGGGERLVQLNRVPVTFEYEFNYAEAPSNLTNQRWESLFPLAGGFFRHPTLGHDPVAFSVFHQLHCLDGIRNAYWSVRNGNQMEEGHSHHGDHSSDTHIRHCLEYLRQSVICAADTTIEPTQKGAGGEVGVAGFGTEHMCRDFSQLVEWTSRWELKPRTT